MMTFLIHIKGIVQGVGFRPYVYKQAISKNIKGFVLNGSEGVQVKFNAINDYEAEQWMQELINNAPKLSRVTSYALELVNHESFTDFRIEESKDEGQPDIPLTPDFAMCDNCRKELEDESNTRYNYPFITCTDCGPRYSITKKVPYDRVNTTMDVFQMCPACREEYNDPLNRRHFSQTNSCPECRVEMELYDTETKEIIALDTQIEQIDYAVEAILKKQIVAVKGIGGYLLICDASDDDVVSKLRERKHRPQKPFAVLYSDIKSVVEKYSVSEEELIALTGTESPIVLLKPRRDSLLSKEIAPGLSTVGVMLPYAPLLHMISKKAGRPLVATSANISGSPIIHKDDIAKEELQSIADLILSNNRDILVPQDDSVVRFTEENQHRVILRRSRGMAPNLFTNLDLSSLDKYLAVGADMKGAFALINRERTYLSQFLGNMSTYHSQLSFEKVLNHLLDVLGIQPKGLISDLHPSYFGYQWCDEYQKDQSIEWNKIQHHYAHFMAVLGENDILESDPVLGFIWDGTGLSPDNEIWGSEALVWESESIRHLGNIGYVPHLSGDQMALQPRLSLLAFTDNQEWLEKYVKPGFSASEWESYKQVKEKSKLKTSSMGRMFDAVACLLTGRTSNTFEGQSAMYLEELARNGKHRDDSWKVKKDIPIYSQVFQNVYHALERGLEKEVIAYQFHVFLVNWVEKEARSRNIQNLAFSGGVFQNALLVDLLIDQLSGDFQLYFHKDLSPNDENIAFGQLVHVYAMEMSTKSKKIQTVE